jgi:hypothetical protein
MSSNNKRPNSAAKTVEDVVSDLMDGRLPVKSVVVIRDVIAGVILGEADETEHELELAAGVTYVVVGLGKLPSEFMPGVNFVEMK